MEGKKETKQNGSKQNGKSEWQENKRLEKSKKNEGATTEKKMAKEV